MRKQKKQNKSCWITVLVIPLVAIAFSWFSRHDTPPLQSPQPCVSKGLGVAPHKLKYLFSDILNNFKEYEPRMVHEDPPIIVLDKFLTPEEIASFLKHGNGRYEKSMGVVHFSDGTMGAAPTPSRTSSHAWCMHSECLNDPHVVSATQKLSDLIRIPSDHFEYAQLVYYHTCSDERSHCSFYKAHNDYIEGDGDRVHGARILTLFAYLNDVEEGGETRFTTLPSGPLSVKPRAGRAVLWPSVKNEDPREKDERTDHEALPVKKGEKFGANFWVHQHDFVTPHKHRCP